MKNILITGASSGIGAEIASLLSKQNNVFLSGRRKLDKENYFACDLSDINQINTLYSNAKSYFNGKCNGCCTCNCYDWTFNWTNFPYIIKKGEKMAMMELVNISKKFGEKVVFDNFNISFEENKITAVLGESGCGKTTLLNIIGGLDKYTSGDLIINGVSTKKYKLLLTKCHGKRSASHHQK